MKGCKRWYEVVFGEAYSICTWAHTSNAMVAVARARETAEKLGLTIHNKGGVREIIAGDTLSILCKNPTAYKPRRRK